MRTVMRAIFEAKRAYATLPLFEFMRDETLTPRQRLAFFPCMAPFILAFGDLNKYVMRDETSTDPYQPLVNRHTYEDDHHWPWYLEDLTTARFLRSHGGDEPGPAVPVQRPDLRQSHADDEACAPAVRR